MLILNNCRMHLVIVQTPLAYMNNMTYNRQEIGLAKALVKKGINVSLIFSSREEKVEEIDGKIKIYYLRCKKFNQQIGFYKGLWNMLDSLKPDILQILEFGMFMSFSGLLWAKKRNVKCVVIQGSYELTRKPIYHQLEVIFNITIGKYILRNVDGVGCKTYAARDYLNSYHKRDVFITPVGLDVSRFKEPEAGVNIKKELGLDEDSKLLLYIGTIEHRRHVDMLVKTIEQLPKEYSLAIVGKGSMKDEIVRYCERRVLGSRIFWLGTKQQEELPIIYKGADLFLLASDYEIYGMVILEAMYWGVPVLATKTGGALSIIKDGKCGYLIDSFDEKVWKDKILSIFDDASSITTMRASLRIYIEEYLTWDTTSDKFLNLYNSVL